MSRSDSLIGWASLAVAGCAGLVAFAFPGTPRADLVDPTVGKTIAIGDGGAIAPCDRSDAQRTGRVASLPQSPKPRWVRSLGTRIELPPVVAQDGTIMIVTGAGGFGGGSSALLQLGAVDGVTKITTKIESAAGGSESVAGGPVVLANGLRVVVTVRGEAIGIDPAGTVKLRTALGGELASVPRVGIVPLPSGGFAIARRSELLELDSAGAIVGRTRIETQPNLAARKNGEIVLVLANGELYTWRAGRVPHLVGTFGEKGSVGNACSNGPIVDGDPPPAPVGRRERVLCVSEGLVEQIDLASGQRRALLAKTFFSFRTTAAVGQSGELAVVGAGGTLLGIGPGGIDLGPVEVPGAPLIQIGKDGGVNLPPSGEIAPLLAPDGSALFGSGDGIAIVSPGQPAQKVARCMGASSSTIAGVAWAGPSAIVVACNDGHVEVVADGALGTKPKP